MLELGLGLGTFVSFMFELGLGPFAFFDFGLELLGKILQSWS